MKVIVAIEDEAPGFCALLRLFAAMNSISQLV